jgi:hypothetical protein
LKKFKYFLIENVNNNFQQHTKPHLKFFLSSILDDDITITDKLSYRGPFEYEITSILPLEIHDPFGYKLEVQRKKPDAKDVIMVLKPVIPNGYNSIIVIVITYDGKIDFEKTIFCKRQNSTEKRKDICLFDDVFIADF